MYIDSVVLPVKFQLTGKFNHPNVLVDEQQASDLDTNDLNLAGGEDKIDPTISSDRMIYNQANTPLGITIGRKVYAWSQQYHDNYYIYDYVFKNTGLIDDQSDTLRPPTTLTGVVFYFTYRFADANDAYREGWGFATDDYGRNTINDCIGDTSTRELAPPNNFRAIFEYYGPGAYSSGVSDCIGGPDFQDGHALSGSAFTGEMVLHVDKSAHDTTDDPNEPATTQYTGSEGPLQVITLSMLSDSAIMAKQYQLMTMGHPAQTQAQALGEDANGWPTGFSDTWVGSPTIGLSAGGYQSEQGFGPYTLGPGDSIHIVICEAVAGISREFGERVAKNWFTWYSNGRSETTPLPLPAKPPSWTIPTWPVGGTTTDGNVYKNAWVFTGKDSLLQTFGRARANYLSGYKIPQPPPPPDEFLVTSGGSEIKLQWSTSAESAAHFDGYLLYRAENRTDTVFDLLESFNKGGLPPLVDGYRTWYDSTVTYDSNYYYYVQAKDDGSTNDIAPGIPLVSGKFYTMTNVPDIIASVHATKDGFPTQFSLLQNYPNPFNPSTTISYQLSTVSRVTLKVFDVLGREVATLMNEVEKPGSYGVRFDGSRLASGVYFYKLVARPVASITADVFTQVKQMVIVK